MVSAYGIILFDGSSKGNVLAFKRRDTYSYITLLRGSWSTMYEIKDLIRSMRKSERHRLLHHSIDELWDDFWVCHNLKIYSCTGIKKKYERFEQRIKNYIGSLSDTQCRSTMQMWEFPKGKRESRESDLECAIREFVEESRIPASSIRIIDKVPIYIKYRGTDGKIYENYYYLATTTKDIVFPPQLYLPGRIRTLTHSGEASKIAWLSPGMVRKRMSPQNRMVYERALDIYTKTMDLAEP